MGPYQAPGENHVFGGGLHDTALSLAYLTIMLAAIVLMYVLPKRYMVLPFLAGIFLIPASQEIYAFGAHWFTSRILVLAGLARVTGRWFGQRRLFLTGGVNPIDWAVFAWILSEAIAFVLTYHATAAVVFECGVLIDYLGAYILVRAMIQDHNAVRATLKCLAILTVILGIEMLWEQIARQNIFGVLAGTEAIPELREGKIRSQAVFQHALTAGVFAATLLPMFLMLCRSRKAPLFGVAGIVGCTVMTICSYSSTPLLGWIAGATAVFLWPLRAHLRIVRRVFVVVLVTLHLAMKSPVWFLIARIDLTGGSSGYHRAELVDQFIKHFGDWWLLGTANAGNWGFDLWDTQNQFVAVGETGGLLTLMLFILLLKRAFGHLGTARRRTAGTPEEWDIWLLGCALFSTVVCFFGINYFDQIRISLFVLFAILTVITGSRLGAPVIAHKKKIVCWNLEQASPHETVA